MKTLVLLSGGLDSATVLAWCLQHGEAEAIGFDYGQWHLIELDRAAKIAEHYSVPFRILSLPLTPLVDEVVFAGRNLMFASVAIAVAQARQFDAIAVGCNATDWVRFADCLPAFWKAVAAAAETYGVQVATPLLHKTKHEVVAEARALGVPIDLTWSCYSPRDGSPCGECLACTTRQEALAA